MTDDRIAKIINATMFSILSAMLFGFAAWGAITGFLHMRAIYRSLSPSEQHQVFLFFNSVSLLFLTVSMGSKALHRWLSRRAPKP